MTTPPAGNGADPEGSTGAGPASPRRDRMLSELAGEIRAARAEERRDVAALQAELARIAALLGENADLLAQVLPRVGALDTELADLAGRVDELTGATPAVVAPVDWPALSADAAAAEWEALASWVADVLGPFYEITRAQLPDCWALHRPAVIELVWLRRCYAAAHAPDAAPGAAGEWHTRWRRGRPGQHRHRHPEDVVSTGRALPPRTRPGPSRPGTSPTRRPRRPGRAPPAHPRAATGPRGPAGRPGRRDHLPPLLGGGLPGRRRRRPRLAPGT
jgi:hypothetical protein